MTTFELLMKICSKLSWIIALLIILIFTGCAVADEITIGYIDYSQEKYDCMQECCVDGVCSSMCFNLCDFGNEIFKELPTKEKCTTEGLSPELREAYEELQELLKDEPDIKVRIICPEEAK